MKKPSRADNATLPSSRDLTQAELAIWKSMKLYFIDWIHRLS